MITIAEAKSGIWTLKPTFGLRVDRSTVTVSEYLQSKNIHWNFEDSLDSDICLYKGEPGQISVKSIADEVMRRMKGIPFITLIGEPRELAPAAYLLSRHRTTLAVAPGDSFTRLNFASEWADPKLEGWKERLDRLCWIARPTPQRIAFASKMIELRIPLDIFSKEKWPFENWKGYVENEHEVAMTYRYRIVFENSCSYGYHSEKLFNSIRSGCVTFYHCDPALNLATVSETCLPLTMDSIVNRAELSADILAGIDRFMFSNAWEIYSFKSFYDRIISLSMRILTS